MNGGPVSPIRFLDLDVPTVAREVIAHHLRQHFGLEGELTPFESERDLVFQLSTERQPFVVRVSNAAETPGVVDMQIKALRHIEAQAPDLPTPRVVTSLDGETITHLEAGDGTGHLVTVVSYLPGHRLRDTEAADKPALRRNLGLTLGQFASAMQGFFHPSAGNEHPWDILRSHQLAAAVPHIADPSTRTAAKRVLGDFGERVMPQIGRLRHQVIHQDAHGGNVLVNDGAVSGLIDFGDMVWGPLPSEIAIAADPAWSNDDPVGALCDVMAGFDRTHPLLEPEVEVLFDLVLARVAATITIEAARQTTSTEQHPAAEGIDRYADLLDELLGLDRDAVDRQLRATGRFPARSEATAERSADLARRRQLHLGKSAPHFYEEPFHVERGDGVWLFASDGTQYLDFYNNVPQVGHNHPHVVNAIGRQAGALNTNSRYLYEAVVDYAERLTGLLGPGLDACLFVNSGSEANDVALQMARFATGRRGTIVMDGAYHGVTTATRELSTADADVVANSQIAELMVPDPYRGRHRAGEPDLADKYAADAERALGSLTDRGHQVAAFVVDPAMCSNGMPAIPSGYLANVAGRVKASGGLVVVDEVQSGLGRTGQWWGHELHDVEPDIVTMGKPIGNGHPLGVVVTNGRLLDAFMARTKLFSTFGGNPVAATAGMAVLDVIEREGLIAHSAETGSYLRDELRHLQSGHTLVGDVRGWGMITAVELVTDLAKRTPATSETRQLVELMRKHGVLVGSAGSRSNVLKLRPPLITERQHVDLFLQTLAASLDEIADSIGEVR